MELERRAALAARIERAQQREQQSIRSSRAQALRAIAADGPELERAQQRTMEWMNAEASAWREQQLLPLAQAAARLVGDGRQKFFESRKEREQVETVLDAEQARSRAEQERRTQRELDDWFAIKQTGQRRNRS